MTLQRVWRKIAENGTVEIVVRLLGETGRRFAGRYALVIALSIVVALTTAANAWILKDVVNKIFFEKNEGMLYALTVFVLVVGFARGFSLYYSSVVLGRIGNAIVAQVQRRLFNHMLNLGVDYYGRTPSSELVTRMSHNAQAARQVIELVVIGIGRNVLSLVALVAVMFIQAPLLTLIILVIGPIAVIGVTQLVKRVRGVARAQFTSLSMVISDMQEAARGIRIIKAFNMEPAMRERMDHSIEEVRQKADKIVKIGARSSPLMEVLGGIAISLIVFVAGYQAIYQDTNPGELVSFIAAMALAYEPAKRLARLQISLETALVGVRLMYELLDEEPTIRNHPDAPALDVTDGTVAFEDVTFAYPDSAPLFNGLNFRAEGGQMTALVGHSGSGKTTVMSLIERFYDIQGGRIAIDGQDVREVDTTSLRQAVAFVSQDIVLFRNTIRENIRFGRPEATDEEVEQAARDAMAHDFILQTSDGYDTLLGDDAMSLSGGQRQRLAIARAMLRDAPIVLLDEATSSLDTESEHRVQEAFDRLMRDRTTIVIAHRLSTVLHADKICVLSDGELVEEGRHEELLTLDGQYAHLYRLQFETERKRRSQASGTSVPEPAE